MLRYIQSDTKECLELNGTANILYFKYKCAYMICSLFIFYEYLSKFFYDFKKNT